MLGKMTKSLWFWVAVGVVLTYFTVRYAEGHTNAFAAWINKVFHT